MTRVGSQRHSKKKSNILKTLDLILRDILLNFKTRMENVFNICLFFCDLYKLI